MVQSLAAAAVIRARDLDRRSRAWPGRPAVAPFARGEGVPLLITLQLEGHGYAEIGVVDEAVGKHEVDCDDRGQRVDLANENERQGQQAGETDGGHRSPVGPFLVKGDGQGHNTHHSRHCIVFWSKRRWLHSKSKNLNCDRNLEAKENILCTGIVNKTPLRRPKAMVMETVSDHLQANATTTGSLWVDTLL